jgi:2-methylisocitrate lyase-like PEP mutase family enzyme
MLERMNDLLQMQLGRAVEFRDLHARARPLQIANAWDATSARILAAAGAPAIGTTSFGVALDRGVWDGELLPFEQVLAVTEAIVAAVDVPVTIDLEAGRGTTPTDVQHSVAAVIARGAIGINIEDGVPGQPGVLRDAAEQAERVAAARAAATASEIPIFVNARCDVYFGADVPTEARVDEVLCRAATYRAAGADGLFLPGLLDVDAIRLIVERVELPVNVMVGIGAPSLDELAGAGVRRISQGGEPFLATAGGLKLLTERYLTGQLGAGPDAVGAGMSLIPALVG